MISWTFAAALVLLALVPGRLPAPARLAVVLVLSAAGVALVWGVPVLGVLGVSVVVWAVAAILPQLSQRPRTAVLALAIAAVVAALAWLRSGHPSRTTLVPATAVIGLSYFTLKYVQHLVDAAAGRAAGVGLPAFLATVVFLPTYAAGPIERTNELAEKIAAPPLPWSERVLGVERILLGLGKKLLVGDALLAFAEPAFAEPWLADRGTLWLAMYAFAFAIYLDFAGYSDVAIGAGRLAGIRVRENFDWPYLQPNLTLLWQRWHMSLTGWLRDFVFVPVARRSLRATRRPLLSHGIAQTATMLLCGLWHGLAWNFAAWGLYHAVLLTGLGAMRESARGVPGAGAAPAGPPSRLRHAASVVATFHAFALGLVLFGCSLSVALRYLARMVFADGLLPP